MVAMQVNQGIVAAGAAGDAQVVKADVALVGAPGHKAAAGQGGAVRPTEYLRPVAPYRNDPGIVCHPVQVRLPVGGHQPGIGPVVQSVANALIDVNRCAVLPHQVAVAMISVGGRAAHEVQSDGRDATRKPGCRIGYGRSCCWWRRGPLCAVQPSAYPLSPSVAARPRHMWPGGDTGHTDPGRPRPSKVDTVWKTGPSRVST